MSESSPNRGKVKRQRALKAQNARRARFLKEQKASGEAERHGRNLRQDKALFIPVDEDDPAQMLDLYPYDHPSTSTTGDEKVTE